MKRTYLSISTTCPDRSGNTNKQIACEFPVSRTGWHPVEHFVTVKKLEPKENQKL